MRIEHFWLYCNDRHIFLLIKMFQSTPQINKKTSNKSWIPLIYRCRLSASVLTQCDTTRQEDEKSTEGQTIQICWELVFIFSSPTPTHQPACLLILKEALGLLNVIFFIDFEWLASIHIFRGIPPLKNIRILSGFGPQKVCWVLETPSHGFLWYFDNPSTTLHLIPYLYNKMCIIIYFLPISIHKMCEASVEHILWHWNW